MRSFFFLLFLSASAFGQQTEMDMEIPARKIAKLRVYQEMMDGKVKRDVLVGAHLIPAGSQVRIRTDQPLLYRWILTDDNKIIQSSMPYFPVKVLSLPEEFEGERSPILTGSFFVHIRDLDDAAVIASIYNEELPPGEEKLAQVFAWDVYNPKGTWANAVQRGLREKANQFLVRDTPRDVTYFCPRYFSLEEQEREIFWVALFNQIVRFESAFIPLTASDEGRYDESKKGIISSGLTQISIASSKASCYQARGCNRIKGQNDLFDAGKNLQCAVGIMSCLSESGGCLSCKKGSSWQGIARYWSTMRDPYDLKCPTCPGGKVTVGKKPQIRDLLKSAVAFCH